MFAVFALLALLSSAAGFVAPASRFPASTAVRADSPNMGLAEFLAGGRPLELLSGLSRKAMMEGANQKRFDMDYDIRKVPKGKKPTKVASKSSTINPKDPKTW